MKYRVTKGHQNTYPDGSIRGERGYIIDGSAYYERPTLEDFADALERTERQAVPSPVNVELLWSKPEPVVEPDVKKATKKKSRRRRKKKAAAASEAQ